MQRIIVTLSFVVCLFVPPALCQGQELVISAAASLTDALQDIKPAFEAAHPGTKIILSFASSGACYRQLEQGAPADIFASANPKWMQKAVEARLVDKQSQTVFAHNSLVLAVPTSNPAGITSLKDLADPRVKTIGIGTPKTVPAGKYTQNALTKAGLWSSLKSRYIFGESVRQILDYLRRGEVDCGFIYATDAKKGGRQVTVIQKIPLDKPVTYLMGILASSSHKAEAKTFVDFLTSPQGIAILNARGFSR